MPPLKKPFAQVASRSLVGLAATTSSVVLPASSMGASRSCRVTSIRPKRGEISRRADRAVARDDLCLGPGKLEDAVGGGDHAADPAAARGVDIGIETVGEKVAGVDHVVRREVDDQVAVGVRRGHSGNVNGLVADVKVGLVGRKRRQRHGRRGRVVILNASVY